jgi:hypothetical protein
MSTFEVGELLHDYTGQLTRTTEYGVTFASLAASNGFVLNPTGRSGR